MDNNKIMQNGMIIAETKMGKIPLQCPLCCGKTFETNQLLIQHLCSYTYFPCPCCHSKFENIHLLIEHLSNSCQLPENEDDGDVIEESSMEEVLIDSNLNLTQSSTEENVLAEDAYNEVAQDPLSTRSISENVKKVSILRVQLMKPEEINCLQTRELKLVQENGESRYVIVGDDSKELLQQGKVITKQNTDGTISFTSVKDDVKTTVHDTSVPEVPVDNDSQDDGYSCNTCAMSFSSVFDHIQKYHNNQEVVVEVSDSGVQSLVGPQTSKNGVVDILKEKLEKSVKKQTLAPLAPRRVITEAGNIIETNAPTVTNKDEGSTPLVKKSQTLLSEQVLDKKGRVYTRKFVQIDKFWEKHTAVPTKRDNSSIAVLASGENVKPLYHQVIAKEMDAADGSGKVKVHMCTVCDTCVLTLDEFKAHPCVALKYSCSQCPSAYDNAKSLCAHMKVHKKQGVSKVKKPDQNVNSDGSFECKVCGTVLPSNKSLRLHRRMHDPIKARPIDPPVSDSMDTFSSNFHCEECDKWIPYGYKKIHENYHKAVPQYNCEICNRKFLSNDFLVMHMGIHNVDKVPVPKPDKLLPYTCLYCNKQFSRPHEKVKHERIHTGEKPHSCEICGKTFRVSYCLTLHMRTHTGARPYECQHCGKRFKAHSVYNHHLLTHSEIRAYKCPFCPKAFKTSVQLAGHKNSHTKPFSCKQCNRPFSSLYAVRVHTETHRRQNNLKYSCSLCGASYARTFSLKDHIKQAHMQEAKVETEMIDKDKVWRKIGYKEDDNTLTVIVTNDEMNTEVVEMVTSEPDSSMKIEKEEIY